MPSHQNPELFNTHVHVCTQGAIHKTEVCLLLKLLFNTAAKIHSKYFNFGSVYRIYELLAEPRGLTRGTTTTAGQT